MTKKRAFTLLEVIVVIALLSLAAGTVGWKLHQMILKKRFTSSVERLRSRLHTCRRLALNMQADWKGVLSWKEKHWIFEAFCPDSPSRPLLPLLLDDFVLFLNDEEQQVLTFDFAATGEVYPKGVFVLSLSKNTSKKSKIIWKIPEIFLLEEGNKLGPLAPDEMDKSPVNRV